MKKVLLCAAFAVFALTTTNAQDEDSSGLTKSDVYMSGTVSFFHTDFNVDSSSAYTVSPAIGFMLSDKIALEANLAFGNQTDILDDELSSFGFGAGARWFVNPGSKFSFNVGAGFAYNTLTEKEEGFDDLKTNTVAFGIAPGLNYWVSDKFGLIANVAALTYSSSKLDIDDAEAVTTIALNLDLSDINFGMVYKF